MQPPLTVRDKNKLSVQPRQRTLSGVTLASCTCQYEDDGALYTLIFNIKLDLRYKSLRRSGCGAGEDDVASALVSASELVRCEHIRFIIYYIITFC